VIDSAGNVYAYMNESILKDSWLVVSDSGFDGLIPLEHASFTTCALGSQGIESLIS
jgi:hypothetical protein